MSARTSEGDFFAPHSFDAPPPADASRGARRFWRDAHPGVTARATATRLSPWLSTWPRNLGTPATTPTSPCRGTARIRATTTRTTCSAGWRRSPGSDDQRAPFPVPGARPPQARNGATRPCPSASGMQSTNSVATKSRPRRLEKGTKAGAVHHLLQVQKGTGRRPPGQKKELDQPV